MVMMNPQPPMQPPPGVMPQQQSPWANMPLYADASGAAPKASPNVGDETMWAILKQLLPTPTPKPKATPTATDQTSGYADNGAAAGKISGSFNSATGRHPGKFGSAGNIPGGKK